MKERVSEQAHVFDFIGGHQHEVGKAIVKNPGTLIQRRENILFLLSETHGKMQENVFVYFSYGSNFKMIVFE